MTPATETERLLDRLRLLIYFSSSSQQDLERRAGFSAGFLSQLSSGAIDVKLRPLFLLLGALQIRPADFFHELFPPTRNRALEALQKPRRLFRSRGRSIDRELTRLFGFGLECIEDFVERLERCEDALAELRDRKS